ncbi:MAG: TIR domain-containing protein [Bacteroidales bacterium]|jgi:hypothetical protein|nr:TIR domain-containing protein [Bacteroidales bacterium]
MTAKARKKNIISPLKVFIIWHSGFADGKWYADTLYNIFSRDEKDFTGHSVDLPIYYLTTPQWDFDNLIKTTGKVAFVLLIDSKMISTECWKIFVNDLYIFCNNNPDRIIYPVTFANIKSACLLSKELAQKNFINLENVGNSKNKSTELQEKIQYLSFELAHELCRFLYNRERVAESSTLNQIPPSIKVFLSHSRIDGKNIADAINTYVLLQTSLKTFIDVNDIPKGSNFAQSIAENIGSSALLAICTDKYSSREWCQKEVLLAKQKNCPIIILDALEIAEIRRFPYSSNVKVIHLGHTKVNDARCKKIIYELLLETLKVKYNEWFLRYSVNLYKIDESQTKIFCYPPELYTLLMNLGNNDKLIVYPEPPLNVNEITILKRYCNNREFLTTTFLPCINCNTNNLLANKNIGLSISETNIIGNIARTNIHLTTFYIELCRYLLAADANLLYTGDVNYNGKINFLTTLQELISNYCFNPEKVNRIIIHHLPSTNITEEQKMELLPYFQFIEVETNNIKLKKTDQIRANLTALRTQVNVITDARIVMGGKTQGYSGRCPGVLEEAYIALSTNKPIYVLGAYGGVAELVMKYLAGENLTDVIDEEIASYFNSIGFGNLHNGLSKKENIELSSCEDIHRSIALILQGLKKIATEKKM